MNSDLKEDWQEYLEQTKAHVTALESVCRSLGIDPEKETSGRQVVRLDGGALPAVLPPPEEQRHAKTAIGAARAEQAAEKLRFEQRALITIPAADRPARPYVAATT